VAQFTLLSEEKRARSSGSADFRSMRMALFDQFNRGKKPVKLVKKKLFPRVKTLFRV
jgi:hypothetical protein